MCNNSAVQPFMSDMMCPEPAGQPHAQITHTHMYARKHAHTHTHTGDILGFPFLDGPSLLSLSDCILL